MSTLDNTKNGTFSSPFTRNDTRSVYNLTTGDKFKLFDSFNSKFSKLSNVNVWKISKFEWVSIKLLSITTYIKK